MHLLVIKHEGVLQIRVKPLFSCVLSLPIRVVVQAWILSFWYLFISVDILFISVSFKSKRQLNVS